MQLPKYIILQTYVLLLIISSYLFSFLLEFELYTWIVRKKIEKKRKKAYLNISYSVISAYLKVN